MKDITPIRDETSYEATLAEVRRLWGAVSGTKTGDRLEVLMILVDDYENKHHAIEAPDPIEAIRIRMEDMGLERADLGKMLGIASGRVSEILNRRRGLTVTMMRVLASTLRLPESCLLQHYDLLPTSPKPGSRRTDKQRQKVAA
jgi:HTH-type transcriptional regulator / antitoxin HigA